MLRVLYRFLSLATLLACAGMLLPTGGSTRVLAVVQEVVATASTESAWQAGDEETGVSFDMRPVESDDDDDDDDPFCDVADGAALAFRWVPTPRRPEQAPRTEVSGDTSRFAAGTGLPRGPPSAA